MSRSHSACAPAMVRARAPCLAAAGRPLRIAVAACGLFARGGCRQCERHRRRAIKDRVAGGAPKAAHECVGIQRTGEPVLAPEADAAQIRLRGEQQHHA